MKVRNFFVPAVAAGLLSLSVLGNAQTFAQQNVTQGRPFQFLNTGTTSTSGLTSATNASAAVAGQIVLNQGFYFTGDATGLGYTGPTGPVSSINAILTINNAVATGPASGITPAGNRDQTLLDVTAGPTLSYTVNGTQTIGGFTFTNGSNLLSIFLGGPFQFSAENPTVGNAGSGRVANITQSTSVATPVIYSSAYLTLTNQFQQNFGYTFNNAANQTTIGANGVLGTNVYNGAGIFSLDITASQTPEPGAVAMLVGMGVSGSVFVLRRRRK